MTGDNSTGLALSVHYNRDVGLLVAARNPWRQGLHPPATGRVVTVNLRTVALVLALAAVMYVGLVADPVQWWLTDIATGLAS